MNNSDVANRYAARGAGRLHRISAGAGARRSWWRWWNRDFRILRRGRNCAERVIDSYAIYGATDGVIRAGAKYLTDFPDASESDLRGGGDADGLRVCDESDAGGVRDLRFAAGGIGEARRGQICRHAGQSEVEADRRAIMPDYARVLDRYVARLVSMKRVPEALALYRRELDRNSNDPGLYDTLAAFLEQNKLGAEIEQVYQRAIAQFPDHTWEQKLARWYLKQKRQNDVSKLTRDSRADYSGTGAGIVFSRHCESVGATGAGALSAIEFIYSIRRFSAQSFVRAEFAEFVISRRRATSDDATAYDDASAGGIAYDAAGFCEMRILRAAVAQRAQVGCGVVADPYCRIANASAGAWN